MKKSLFAVMAVFGVLASAQVLHAAVEDETGSSVGESGLTQAVRAGANPTARFSTAPGGNLANASLLFLGGPGRSAGPWSMTANFGGPMPLMMSPFGSPALADGEFKALLSLIDGASIRTRTANAQLQWLYCGYYVSAILLAILAVIYLPWSARPPVGNPEMGPASKVREPLAM